MTRKLLKYDLRCMFKQFAGIWPAALTVALINLLINGGNAGDMGMSDAALAIIPMMIFVGVMIAMCVIAAVFTITRFNSGLLRDEGYLMFTLPVKPWQLILSKLITAILVAVISGIVAFISIVLISAAAVDWSFLVESFGQILKDLMEIITQYPHWLLVFVELLIAGLLGIMSYVLLVYLAISVGHLFTKHRVAAGIVAYIAIYTIVNQLMVTVVGRFMDWGLAEWMREMINSSAGSYRATTFSLGLFIAANLLLCAIYFFGTNYILSKKLNLE